ncbi:MAG TPA: S1 RNA-binding domain-containing protein, partial [Fibrobacteria bacterium]|nr:S1 RNA-binding domain-containing protein [Fibrobacteria bacterium]
MSPKSSTVTNELLYGSAEDLASFEAEAGLTEEQRTALLEKYSGSIGTYKEGSIIKGRVVRVSGDDVFVDIKFKSEGVIPKAEFREESELVPGTEIDVYLDQVENNEGQVILSKQRADFMRV